MAYTFEQIKAQANLTPEEQKATAGVSTNQYLGPGGQVNIPTTLNATNTAPSQKTVLPPAPTPTTDTGSVVGGEAIIKANQALFTTPSGAQVNAQGEMVKSPEQSTQSNSILDYIKSITGIQPPSASQTYNDISTQSGIAEKESKVQADAQAVLNAQSKFGAIDSQLQGLAAQAQAVPIQMQQDSVGRGRTAGGLAPLQADELRKLALQAIPLQTQALVAQAEVAAAQGNAQLSQSILQQAQTHMDKVFQIQMQDAQNKYEYQSNLIDKVYAFADKQEQRQLEAQKEERNREYQEEQETIAYNRQIERDKILNSFKPVGGGGSGGFNNVSTDNERALMSQFRGEQIVKDYNEILAQKGTIDSYIQNGVGGPADLALVFSFMKGLDPNSVVRESEYETAAKSGNIFQGAFAKFNGYLKDKGGFLPANVRQEFQNLVNQKLNVKEAQYTNVKKQYEGVASRQGLNPQNVVIDYAGGALTPPPANQTIVPLPTDTPQAKGFFKSIGDWLFGSN
jgi:hypothetical protein